MATAVIADIERCIAADMRRYNVSRSFVIATALAHTYGVEEQPDFKKVKR